MNNIKKTVFKTGYEDDTPPPTFSEFHFSNPGRNSGSLACAETTYPDTFYTEFTGGFYPALGATMYLNSGLTTPVGGGDFWFKNLESGIEADFISYQINSSGVIVDFFTCAP